MGIKRQDQITNKEVADRTEIGYINTEIKREDGIS